MLNAVGALEGSKWASPLVWDAAQRTANPSDDIKAVQRLAGSFPYPSTAVCLRPPSKLVRVYESYT